MKYVKEPCACGRPGVCVMRNDEWQRMVVCGYHRRGAYSRGFYPAMMPVPWIEEMVTPPSPPRRATVPRWSAPDKARLRQAIDTESDVLVKLELINLYHRLYRRAERKRRQP